MSPRPAELVGRMLSSNHQAGLCKFIHLETILLKSVVTLPLFQIPVQRDHVAHLSPKQSCISIVDIFEQNIMSTLRYRVVILLRAREKE